MLDLRRMVFFTSFVASLEVSSDWKSISNFRVKVPVNFRVNFKCYQSELISSEISYHKRNPVTLTKASCL